MKPTEYRLVQNGEIVAQVSGPAHLALVEMYRYARMYAEDGPITTEVRVGKKWVPAVAGAQP